MLHIFRLPQSPKMTLTPLEFRRRFSFEERVGIELAAREDAEVKVLMDDLALATFVDTEDPDVVQGMNLLEFKGLIGSGRAQEILAH